MKILIACEFSATVRDAFRALGHDAWSCDLLPCKGDPAYHIQGDVLAQLDKGWDMMIAHPPCTYLTFAGIRWFNEEKYGDKARERKRLRDESLEFFRAILNAPIPKIAIENPVGFANSMIRKPDQIIQPYYFGDPHVKAACLWLKGLPKLEYDKGAKKPEPLSTHLRKPGGVHKEGKICRNYFAQGISKLEKNGMPRWAARSVTFPGIANAMATQWGTHFATVEVE